MTILQSGITKSLAEDYTIDQSLRFNDGDNGRLSRTPSSASDRRTFTISCWVKRGSKSAACTIFGDAGADKFAIHDDYIALYLINGSIGAYLTQLTTLIRDPAAWYHIVYVVDTTESTDTDRLALYLNGEKLTPSGTPTYPSQDAETGVNNNALQEVGAVADAEDYDGYLAEVCLIDGQALTPSSFGERNTTTNQWVPIDVSGLTFGTNGFYQKYVSGSTDTTFVDSSNSNVFTPTESLSVNYLVVGGGGAGPASSGAGGGGAGGMRTGTGHSVTAKDYTIVVGVGGTNWPDQDKSMVASGGSSRFDGIVGHGGGAGGSSNRNGVSGGSGGGGSYNASAVGGAGNTGGYAVVEGYAGGTGAGATSGGGGGAGAVGGNASADSSSGNGGAGVSSSITGSAVTYAGGGGGGSYSPATNGSGGAGGGGDGAQGAVQAGKGEDGKGGGAGGLGEANTYYHGGTGGSGVVIISYISTTPKATGGTITSYVDGDTYQVHTFTKASGRSNDMTDYAQSYGGTAGNDIIVKGDVVHTQAETKVGASSIWFAGTDDWMTIPPGTPAWNFTDEFTFESWVYIHGDSAGSERLFNISANTNLASQDAFYIWFDSLNLKVSNAATISVAVLEGQWYHIAVTRNSSDLITVWIDGVSQDTETVSGTVGSTRGDLTISGNLTRPNVLEFTGYLSEVRISDSCRYDATFTPSTDEFTADDNTLLLMHSNYDGGFGSDSSGNNNDYAVTNLVATDGMKDSPTNNFATWNPLNIPTSNDPTFSEGNLQSVVPTGWGGSSTIEQTSGKWYAEFLFNASTGASEEQCVGVIYDANITADANEYPGRYSRGYSYYRDGDKINDGNYTSYGDSYTTGDIIGVALNLDDDELKFYKNNVVQNSGTAISITTGQSYGFAIGQTSGSRTATWIANFGQDSSFAGNATAQGNQDGNEIGDFYFPPPTDFLALCTSNLPDPEIVLPGDNFNTVIYDDGAGAKTGVGFQPDLVWVKSRGSTYEHEWTDAVRGVTEALSSDSTNAETTDSTGLTAFGTDGFTVGADTNYSDTTGSGMVAWNWLASTTFDPATDGSITTGSGRSNDTAGFSIVGYTGNSASSQTIGHGLSVAPELIIIKNRTDVSFWPAGTAFGGGWTKYLNFDSVEAQQTGTYFNDTPPTASVFSVSTNNAVNGDTNELIAYCFHSVEGYSKIGSYEGNANADGTFIYTGFRPAFFMTKNIVATNQGWITLDSVRSPFNSTNLSGGKLDPSNTAIESDNSIYAMDFVSNGVKLIGTDGGINAAQDYIYIAIAEFPFKYANAR